MGGFVGHFEEEIEKNKAHVKARNFLNFEVPKLIARGRLLTLLPEASTALQRCQHNHITNLTFKRPNHLRIFRQIAPQFSHFNLLEKNCTKHCIDWKRQPHPLQHRLAIDGRRQTQNHESDSIKHLILLRNQGKSSLGAPCSRVFEKVTTSNIHSPSCGEIPLHRTCLDNNPQRTTTNTTCQPTACSL